MNPTQCPKCGAIVFDVDIPHVCGQPNYARDADLHEKLDQIIELLRAIATNRWPDA